MEKKNSNKATGKSLGEAVKKLEDQGAITSRKALEAQQKAEEKAKQKEDQKAARQLAAEKYQELKKKVLDREADNYSEIILLQDKEKPGDKKKRWWKVFGHSVYILKHKVGAAHGLAYKIQEDSDFGIRSREGVILIPNLNNFVELMTRKGYKVSGKGAECIVIDIKEKLTIEQYQALVEIDKHLEKRLHTLVRPEYMVQDLYAAAKELDKKMDEMVRKLDQHSRDVYGDEMEKTTVWISRKLLRVARGSYDYKQYLEEMSERIEEIWGYIAVMMNRRAFAFEKIVEVAEALRGVEKQVEREKIALKRKETNANNLKTKQAERGKPQDSPGQPAENESVEERPFEYSGK